jgi:predicted GIY-YIG superfamily endonuclease
MNNKNKTFIYALTDSDTVRYVGKSDNPKRRKSAHILESKNDTTNSHKCNWVNKMIRSGKEIGFKILEEVNYNEWEDREKYWINYYGFDNLVNETIGGLGSIDINGESTRKYNKDMKRSKNLKITPTTHKILKDYCNENGLKMFGFVEKIIKEACKKPTDLYGEH